MGESKRVDVMSIFMEKDKETDEFVDYIYMSNVYTNDPRFKSRNICIGQMRGLFRINKASLEVAILMPMEYDYKHGCCLRASGKILKQFKENNEFPNKSAFQSG
jgi:hypothetical protein